jgi:hypothetical protein
MAEKMKGLLKKPIFWVAIAAVAIFAVWRGRASRAAGAPQGQAPAFAGGGGGFGGGAGAPVSGGQGIMDRLAELDLQSEQQKLSRQKFIDELAGKEETRRFNLLGPAEAARAALDVARSTADTATERFNATITGKQEKQLEKTGLSCPGNASLRLMPDGQGGFSWQCREKTSGGVPGYISRIVGGVLRGVQTASPDIGAGASQAAAAYYTQRLVRSPGSKRQQGGMQRNAMGATGAFGGTYGDQG